MAMVEPLVMAPYCAPEPLLLRTSSGSKPTGYSCSSRASSSGDSSHMLSFDDSRLLHSLLTPADSMTLQNISGDCLLSGSSDELSSSYSIQATPPAARSAPHLSQHGVQAQVLTPLAAAGSAATVPTSAIEAGCRMPSFDAVWPSGDLQELLRFGDAEFMAPFPLDDDLHLSLGASQLPLPQPPPPAPLLPLLGAASPQRGASQQAAEAAAGAATPACGTPPQAAEAAAGAANSRSETPEHPLLAPAPGSTVAGSAAGSPGAAGGRDAPQAAELAGSGAQPSGVALPGPAGAAAGAQPLGRPARGGRKRGSASPAAAAAAADPPRQLQEFEKRQAIKREQDRRNQENCRARKRQRREEGLARIAQLRAQIEWQEGAATGLALANATLQQRLAPPLASCQAAGGVQLGGAAPDAVACLAACLTVHGFPAAAGLALQRTCSGADLQSICKAVAGCLRRLMAHGPAVGLVSLLGAMQKVLETVWEAQPTLWQIMVGASASATASPAAGTETLLAALQLTEAQRATLAAALSDRGMAMDLVARRRATVAAELQATVAAEDSDVSHILLVQTASKAADHAGCMAAQAMAADREFVHAVCFGALSASQAATVMAVMWESGVDMAALCRVETAASASLLKAFTNQRTLVKRVAAAAPAPMYSLGPGITPPQQGRGDFRCTGRTSAAGSDAAGPAGSCPNYSL